MEKRQLINYRQVEICRNEQIVLQKTDFELFGGEFVYLIGRVGSGKSTLLKTIYAEVSHSRWRSDGIRCKHAENTPSRDTDVA